jgi:hypothetical protein
MLGPQDNVLNHIGSGRLCRNKTLLEASVSDAAITKY